MSFSSGQGYDFLLRCVEHKARLVGADAVVLADSHTTAQQYTYSVPGYTTTQPVTTYSNANANYYGSGGYGYGTASGTSTTYVPMYHEGYTGTGVAYRTHIDAFMLRLQ